MRFILELKFVTFSKIRALSAPCFERITSHILTYSSAHFIDARVKSSAKFPLHTYTAHLSCFASFVEHIIREIEGKIERNKCTHTQLERLKRFMLLMIRHGSDSNRMSDWIHLSQISPILLRACSYASVFTFYPIIVFFNELTHFSRIYFEYTFSWEILIVIELSMKIRCSFIIGNTNAGIIQNLYKLVRNIWIAKVGKNIKKKVGISEENHLCLQVDHDAIFIFNSVDIFFDSKYGLSVQWTCTSFPPLVWCVVISFLNIFESCALWKDFYIVQKTFNWSLKRNKQGWYSLEQFVSNFLPILNWVQLE